MNDAENVFDCVSRYNRLLNPVVKAENREANSFRVSVVFSVVLLLRGRTVNTQRLSLYMLRASSFQYCFVLLCFV